MIFREDHLKERDNDLLATPSVIVKQAMLERDMETASFKSNSGIWNPY